MRGKISKTVRTALCLGAILTAAGVSAAPLPSTGQRVPTPVSEPVRTRLAPHSAALADERVRRIVLRAGFAEIERVRREGDRILVDAVSGDGAAFRLALDGASGDIIGRERLGWARGDRLPPPEPALALQAEDGG